MSLSRLALRICTVRALRDRTWAGPRVRDSEIGPIDDIGANEPQPVVVVYTDEGSFNPQGRGLVAQGGVVALVLEMVVTQRMAVTLEHGTEVRWDVPMTDAAMEFTLDVMERQALLALSRADDPWAELWRRLVLSFGDERVVTQRGSAGRDGLRFAGRQITVPVNVVKDPAPGEPLPDLWEDFFAAIAGDSDLAPVASMLRSVAEGEPAATAWDKMRESWGLSREDAYALLLAQQDGAAPVITDVAAGPAGIAGASASGGAP